jgi:hypothetical protein
MNWNSLFLPYETNLNPVALDGLLIESLQLHWRSKRMFHRFIADYNKVNYFGIQPARDTLHMCEYRYGAPPQMLKSDWSDEYDEKYFADSSLPSIN